MGMLRSRAPSSIPASLGQGGSPQSGPGAGSAVAWLSAGFLFSAVLTVAVVDLVGAAFGIPLIPLSVRAWAAVSLCAALIPLDVASLRARTLCKITARRQTPKNLIYHYGPRRGPLMWGLDTGLLVTTLRVSAVTWAMVVLVFLNLAPWWLGLSYGVGFCIPLAAIILLPRARPPAPDGTPEEPQWISYALMRARHFTQIACLVNLFIVTAVLALSN